MSVAFWAFSTLRYDTPECFDALAARAMQLLATEEDFQRANEQAIDPLQQLLDVEWFSPN